MLLSKLVPEEVAAPAAIPLIDIKGLTADSRAVAPGFLFAALAGSRTDGARFVADALAKGAAAILAAEGAAIEASQHVPVLRAREPRRALSLMAARFHARQPAHMLAITGTSGKTSVADFTRQILTLLGRQAASVGTIGLVRPDGAVYGSLTTPDPVSLHATLDALAGDGITHVAFEASSHGLDQHRLDGVRISAAAYTNLGRDHLDYHPTLDAYLAAKLRLFTELLPADGTAVVNADGAEAVRVIDTVRRRGINLITTGFGGDTLQLSEITRDGFSQRVTLHAEGRTHTLRFPLLGSYQVENALVGAGLAMASGEQMDAVLGTLEKLVGVAGRLEIVAEHKGGLAVVDYAHKPEALAAALDALRPFATGKLVCIVGCGGDRDRGKRPIMGRIAVDRADVVIITDDNPRGEDPATIRAEMLRGAVGALEIGDRAEAIATGMTMLGAGDVLLVAGKGHETGQIVGGVTHPFSDHDEIRKHLHG
ncbi:MAG: UDP-N-acetylmuramoyl-L-alanyl-D-glutamate--2,6-diaminopimelate ligase [Hyphomicrobium sp. SCN 65-11]|nr:MAG: UDP-N-acetylmuramoyl-L-alanyl-D-glutamate--2,6-diaminopimelate ligase [Hyphomicrobium sp. SCN 65-11]